jgi:predicted metalloprotease with PDZ domain
MKEGRVVMTPEMLNLQWNATALYPAGYFSRQIMFAASVKLPAGWKLGSALETASVAGATTNFKPVPFNTLVDSPLFAGRYFESVDLDPGAKAPCIWTSWPTAPKISRSVRPNFRHIAISSSRRTKRSARITTTTMIFCWASATVMSGIGLEHHRSSEDGTALKYFTDWDKSSASRDLLSHEYTHSWNGKFRRPADLWTPNFNVPMRDSLLWVYEGQTQYWGTVLAARAGLWTKQQGLDALAADAATFDKRAGNQWRPLEDTTNDPIIAQRRPIPWRSWQRSEDYYGQGELIWLDADTLIRQKTGGKKSLDDFARAFFGIDDGSYVTVTYTFNDIVHALNGVFPYDWAGFLNARLNDPAPAPLNGLAQGGYKLVYTDKPSDFTKSAEHLRKMTDLLYSLGVILDHSGSVAEVLWDGPAFNAGITVGTQIVAVNGQAYDSDDLKDAITAAKTSAGAHPAAAQARRSL